MEAISSKGTANISCSTKARRSAGSSLSRTTSKARQHYDEPKLAALIIWIATTNVWNRINVSTRQVAGEWAKSAEAKKWVENAVARG
jgi:hypothetical protein